MRLVVIWIHNASDCDGLMVVNLRSTAQIDALWEDVVSVAAWDMERKSAMIRRLMRMSRCASVEVDSVGIAAAVGCCGGIGSDCPGKGDK